MYQISLLVKNLALHEGQEKAKEFGEAITAKSLSLGIIEGYTTKEVIYEILPNFLCDPCVDCMFNFITTWKRDYLLEAGLFIMKSLSFITLEIFL